ncbi:MAG: response regulator [Calothrix sp. CSU_2_0]|nr:response regulator [Calothrix sp. CSU_2_0]
MTAKSGSEGLIIAQSTQPDAILLDVMMPEMDGIMTFQKLQANPATKYISVIFLTARGCPVDRSLFANLSVKGIISKPFNSQKLAVQVAALLELCV